jgi:hypothetical protein
LTFGTWNNKAKRNLITYEPRKIEVNAKFAVNIGMKKAAIKPIPDEIPT